MADPARALFDSLATYARIQELIDAGEAEDQYLECKAPHGPQFNRDMRAKLALCASGFGNSGGGVILWGVSTVRHEASGLDVLTQIEPIGNVKLLAQQVDRALPGLTDPQLALESSRILHRAKSDTKGVIVTYIPPTPGDPVQSTVDRHFHFRSGDEFIKMPYQMLRRMFAGAAGPLLQPLFDARLVTIDKDGIWNIPFVVANGSSAAASNSRVSVRVLNPEACESVSATEPFRDTSHVNPGETIFIATVDGPIFRGLQHVIGSMLVRMKKGRRPKRILDLRVEIYADRMRAGQWTFKVQLAKKGFSIKDIKERFVY